jgi:arginyl-tRNA synthetase
MYLWEKLKKDLEKSLVKKSTIKEVEDSDFGDFTARAFGTNPEKIMEMVKLPDWVEKFSIQGNYINFFVDWKKMGPKLVSEAMAKGYGRVHGGVDILIEYSSPNIAKPMHVGHLRNTVLGVSLVRIFEFLGNRVRKVNWYGDAGTQFGKLILAYKLWGNEMEIERNPTKEMMRVYVKFHEEAKKDLSLEDKARQVYKELEEGNNEFVGLWRKFTKLSWKEFKGIYRLLNAEFDNYDGESKYTEGGKKIIEVLKKEGLVKKGDDGALVMEFEGLPTTIIQKKDGTTLYLTRDIATAIERKNKYGFDKMIYVIGSEQNLHLKQLFKSLEMMGYKWAKDCFHVSYGYVSLPEGKMSTREGNVIFAEEVINESIEKARKINRSVAKKVGLGAMNYAILKVEPKRDVVFNWEEVLRLKGNTGPYLQYSAVRAKHILGKTRVSAFKWPEISDDERVILKKISLFPEIVARAGEQFRPNLIANYSYELAELFNNFYEKFPVLKEENLEKKKFRIALVQCVKNVLEKGMFLLNMEVPEKM